MIVVDSHAIMSVPSLSGQSKNDRFLQKPENGTQKKWSISPEGIRKRRDKLNGARFFGFRTRPLRA